MADTARTLAALQALLADNTTGDISPQDVRDLLVSLFPQTTVGDLPGIDVAGIIGRLPATTDGFVLTLDAAQPVGVKWAAIGGHTEDHDHDGAPTQKLLAANTHETPGADTHHATNHAHDGSPTEQLLAANTHVAPGMDTHHAKSHIHDGVDGSGTVAHSATTGQTANDHHAQLHAAAHQNGGADEVATATPGANAIPKAGAGGKLAAGWVQEVLAYADLTDDPVGDHLGDAADAHDASAISVLDTAAQYAATDVEAALAEVLDGLQAHEADAVDAHDASAISNVPAGSVAATTVQAAIDELATDYAAADSSHAGAADPHTGYLLETELFRIVAAQTLAAGDAITVTDGSADRLITSAGNVTLTSEPTIAAGRNGQVVYLHNVGLYNITLQDVNGLGGSLLRLTANTLAIQPGGTMGLMYDSTLGFWCEISLVNPQTFTPSIATFTVDTYSSATREVGGANSLEATSPTNHTAFALTYVGTPSACSIDIDGGEIIGSDYPVTVLTPFLSLLTQPNWYRGTTIGGTRIFTASATVAGEAKTKTVTITYYNSRYAGVNTQATALSSAQTVALGILATDNAYQTSSKSGIAATGSNYIWYCYRSALGTSLYFGVNWKGDGNERAAFTRIGTGTVSVTNASNYIETFEQFKSA